MNDVPRILILSGPVRGDPSEVVHEVSLGAAARRLAGGLAHGPG
jgi:hypothetical protein